MKKLLVIAMILIGFGLNAQVKISEMPTGFVKTFGSAMIVKEGDTVAIWKYNSDTIILSSGFTTIGIQIGDSVYFSAIEIVNSGFQSQFDIDSLWQDGTTYLQPINTRDVKSKGVFLQGTDTVRFFRISTDSYGLFYYEPYDTTGYIISSRYGIGVGESFSNDSSYVLITAEEYPVYYNQSQDSAYGPVFKSFPVFIRSIGGSYAQFGISHFLFLATDSVYRQGAIDSTAFLLQVANMDEDSVKFGITFDGKVLVNKWYLPEKGMQDNYVLVGTDTNHAHWKSMDTVVNNSIDSMTIINIDTMVVNRLTADSAFIVYSEIDTAVINHLTSDSTFIHYGEIDTAVITNLTADTVNVRSMRVSQLSVADTIVATDGNFDINDSYTLYSFTGGAGNDITMPLASTHAGAIYYVSFKGGGIWYIKTQGGEIFNHYQSEANQARYVDVFTGFTTVRPFEGSSSQINVGANYYNEYSKFIFMSDGTDWIIMSYTKLTN